MTYTARVFPHQGYYIAFLNSRGIKIAEEREHVLHYFDTDSKKLKQLVKQDKPDLTIIHNPEFEPKKLDFPFVVDPVACDKDIYSNTEIFTNNYDLAKLYYRKMAISRTIKLEEKPIQEIKEPKHYWSKMKEFMYW